MPLFPHCSDCDGIPGMAFATRCVIALRCKKGNDMPQDAWSEKDERQYEHIKDSAEDRGRSETRAKEIAARTVNKTRREEGKTPNQTTQGTGNPNRPLEERTKDELYNRASDLGIRGRSKMNKHELVNAIRDRE